MFFKFIRPAGHAFDSSRYHFLFLLGSAARCGNLLLWSFRDHRLLCSLLHPGFETMVVETGWVHAGSNAPRASVTRGVFCLPFSYSVNGICIEREGSKTRRVDFEGCYWRAFFPVSSMPKGTNGVSIFICKIHTPMGQSPFLA